MAARRRQDETVEDEPAEEPPVGVDSAGVYEGLSAQDLGYGELPRVEDEESG
ncbi:MAG: hypothetical protein ACR2P8_10515 [Myxococcota bacterium]